MQYLCRELVINFGFKPKWDEINSSYQIHNGKHITWHILTWPDTRRVGFNSLLLEVSPRLLQQLHVRSDVVARKDGINFFQKKKNHKINLKILSTSAVFRFAIFCKYFFLEVQPLNQIPAQVVQAFHFRIITNQEQKCLKELFYFIHNGFCNFQLDASLLLYAFFATVCLLKNSGCQFLSHQHWEVYFSLGVNQPCFEIINILQWECL